MIHGPTCNLPLIPHTHSSRNLFRTGTDELRAPRVLCTHGTAFKSSLQGEGGNGGRVRCLSLSGVSLGNVFVTCYQYDSFVIASGVILFFLPSFIAKTLLSLIVWCVLIISTSF